MYNKNENISKKQLSFVNDLLKRDTSNEAVIENYLKSLKKGTVEELTKKEASSLLDLLLKK
ncbi:MAG: hypothetical protein QXZ44_07365 [Ferroplasma sp.]